MVFLLIIKFVLFDIEINQMESSIPKFRAFLNQKDGFSSSTTLQVNRFKEVYFIWIMMFNWSYYKIN